VQPVQSGEHPQLRGGERAPVEAVQLHRLLARRPVDVTAASLPADGAPAAAFRVVAQVMRSLIVVVPSPAPVASTSHEQDSGAGTRPSWQITAKNRHLTVAGELAQKAALVLQL
jgi:hypothetical protein